jgi:YidC/Oxa1 family membrane protein insertase
MDSQRLILFFVFSFSVFLLLDGWQREQAPALPAATVGDKAGKAGSPEAPSAQIPLPSGKLAPPQSAVPAEVRAAEAGATVQVETDLFIAQISTQGEFNSPRGCRGTFGSNHCGRLRKRAWRYH